MPLLHAPNSDVITDPVAAPAQAAATDQGQAAAEVNWVADQDLVVGGFTLSATTGSGPGSGAITVETGTSDAAGSGHVTVTTADAAGAPADILLDTGWADDNGPFGQVLAQDDSGAYSGPLGSQMLNMHTTVSLDETIGATTETVFSVADAASINFPADFFKVGTSIRYRVMCTCLDPTAQVNAATVRVRLGGLTGVLVGQALALDPSDVGGEDTIMLDGVFTIRVLGNATTGTMVASCLTTGGQPGNTIGVQPYFLASTNIDTTAAQRLVVTLELSTANATTIRLDQFQVTTYG